jgi:hypothetical protein
MVGVGISGVDPFATSVLMMHMAVVVVAVAEAICYY